MAKIELTLLYQMEQKARELRNDAEQEAFIYGAVILLVLGVSLVGAFVVARSMVRSLRRLQDTATKVAQDRLPELVKQFSEADPQDVDTSVESVGVHSRDEIGQVAAAFDDVHREAVRLAAEQALLRGNVNAMFTNLSRRSQGLIQRQLSLISELESREADPDQLSSLFKLDHLATRMRRNGENLLVLAGEEPGRRWTRPVPLVDVLRAAASEVEQYERIELTSVPATEVAGRVVNDLVHLLAELLENATSFSSPQTKVKVTGHALPDGRVLVEIHDTGIGLSPEDLAAINERLASAADRGRLGLPPHGSVRGRPPVPAARHPHPAAPVRLRWYDRAGHAPGRRRPGRRPGSAARQGRPAAGDSGGNGPGLQKGGNLAAALQRGPSGGPGGGAGAARSSSAAPPPAQVGAGGGPAPRCRVRASPWAPSGPGDGGAPTTNFFTDNAPGRNTPPAAPPAPPGSAAAAAFRPGRAAAGRCRVRRQGRSRGHEGGCRPGPVECWRATGPAGGVRPLPRSPGPRQILRRVPASAVPASARVSSRVRQSPFETPASSALVAARVPASDSGEFPRVGVNPDPSDSLGRVRPSARHRHERFSSF